MADDREPGPVEPGAEGLRQELHRAAQVVVKGLAIEASACARAETPLEPAGRDAERASVHRRSGRLPADERTRLACELDVESAVEPSAPLRAELARPRTREVAE
jgi:hypothetical protein